MATQTNLNKNESTKIATEINKFSPKKEEIIFDSIKEEIDIWLNSKTNEVGLSESKVTAKGVDEDGIRFESHKYLFDQIMLYSNNYFTQTQKWIGHIEEIKSDTFIAKLSDISNPTTYEIGEFDFDEISQEDKELVSIGAAFYWSLGRANINGQIEKKSILRFQRVRPWEPEDYDRIVDRAESKYEELNWK